jgi:hypothetical protein
MRNLLLLFLVLAIPPGPPTGSIAGIIELPSNVKITKPTQIVLLSGEYVDFYQAEVQMRVDTYWEDYKSAFIQEKEAFVFFRERAKVQAFELTLNRMRMDDPRLAASFTLITSNSSFEFHGVPHGECKVVAHITIGNQELILSEPVILTDEAPPLVVLKPTTP